MFRINFILCKSIKYKILNYYLRMAQKHKTKRTGKGKRSSMFKRSLFKFQTQSGGKSRKYRKSKRLQMMGG